MHDTLFYSDEANDVSLHSNGKVSTNDEENISIALIRTAYYLQQFLTFCSIILPTTSTSAMPSDFLQQSI